jgi:hypothetical protein
MNTFVPIEREGEKENKETEKKRISQSLKV